MCVGSIGPRDAARRFFSKKTSKFEKASSRIKALDARSPESLEKIPFSEYLLRF
jgi:hypothetical protein